MRMMEEDLRQLLKSHGWNLILRKRHRREYLYAQKWATGEFYVSARTNLPDVQPEDVLKKIKKFSGKK